MNAILCRRVVVDSSSRLTKWLTNPTTHSHPNRQTFTSLYKPSQSRQFRTHYLPSSPSSPPPVSRFDPSLLWRSEKIRAFFSSALVNKAAKLGNLVESSRVGFIGSRFPKNGFEFERFSGFQRRGGGWKHWLQGLSDRDVVLGLVLANTGVFLMWRVFNQQFMMHNFMISLDNFTSGRLHTLITSAFSHIDIGHIVSNMIGLYFFGTSIATNFGPQFLLKLYFAGALGGSVFYLIHHAYLAATSPKGHGAFMRDPSRTPGLGASGAVNAIMLLDIFLHPTATLYLEFIIPVPAMLLGIFLIGKDILRITEGNSNISGSAHLGGAAVAAIAWAGIRKGRIRF
ncbi:PREDICTED: RHOMBOID-like protein 12, mitochondrial [Camelina sativa]|uniref:RHOMBOID-like protein 12, mitochondrial n=1 Tax=Camelina sativa TaxID=90675 RepID=A0ABM0YAT6_CAMSA|nr:PREDICTED: RHOMBOID-like protein 12, mitochondrial [Camelina sativa]